MAAWYNENDKFAAAWLRELIKAGLIADGEVDERSIRLFDQTTCEGSPNAISSPASADGVTPSDSPAGPMTAKSGREAVPVSRGAWREKAMAPTIRAIFGQRGFGSSMSAALASSLASRLRVRLDGRGSTAFRFRWKELVTPSGRLIYQRRASAHHRTARGYGSWQTPTTRDGKGQSGKGNRLKRSKNGVLHVANLCDQIVDLGRQDLVRSTMFRCWLMGFPASWEAARATGMPSSRKSRRSSSAPISTSPNTEPSESPLDVE